MKEILVIDFGSTFDLEILEHLDKLNVNHLLVSPRITVEEIQKFKPLGLILTGSKDNVYDENHRECAKAIFDLGIPILGICYGHQLIHYLCGGEVILAIEEHGATKTIFYDSLLFKDLPREFNTGMFHHDSVIKLAPDFKRIAYTANCENAASENTLKKIYTVQFHPESDACEYGTKIFENFIKICQSIS